MKIYGTFPIEVPGTISVVSENGLKKTTKTFISKTPDQFPGGAYPEPTITKTDFGLYQIQANYYSLSPPSNIKKIITTQLQTYRKQYTDIVSKIDIYGTPYQKYYQWEKINTYLTYSVTIFIAGNAGFYPALNFENDNCLPQNLTIPPPVLISTQTQGNPNPEKLSNSNLAPSWHYRMTSSSRRNYGAFDELDIVVSTFPF